MVVSRKKMAGVPSKTHGIKADMGKVWNNPKAWSTYEIWEMMDT